MKEFLDKLISKLEELKTFKLNLEDEMLELIKKDKLDNYISREEVISIVNQLAEEYNNGWIPCSERLPEESGEYLTWVEYDGDRFIAIDEIDCDGIIKEWNCSTDYKVIAWQPLPQPYQPKGEHDENTK